MSYLEISSSLIKAIDYTDGNLTVYFVKYVTDKVTHANVPVSVIDKFLKSQSQGKFYLDNIQKQFKLAIMAEEQEQKEKKKRLPTKNLASGKKRFIKMRINLSELNKDWFIATDKGVQVDITLQLLPDGKVDKYGNLGMVTQDVPKEVYKADNTVQGAILGNGQEIDWDAFNAAGNSNEAHEVGDDEKNKMLDDLPF